MAPTRYYGEVVPAPRWRVGACGQLGPRRRWQHVVGLGRSLRSAFRDFAALVVAGVLAGCAGPVPGPEPLERVSAAWEAGAPPAAPAPGDVYPSFGEAALVPGDFITVEAACGDGWTDVLLSGGCQFWPPGVPDVVLGNFGPVQTEHGWRYVCTARGTGVTLRVVAACMRRVP